jgi:hypothetical protein
MCLISATISTKGTLWWFLQLLQDVEEKNIGLSAILKTILENPAFSVRLSLSTTCHAP